MAKSTSEAKQKKKLIRFYKVQQKHWVGNGFLVRGLLRPSPDLAPLISPFILLDYAAPMEFPSKSDRRGVGVHPHKGFETVTLAYQGEVEHKDSSGGGGVIKSGDVQWMTAGRGIVHSEYHSEAFAKQGGIFEMVQLWVNLPAKDKLTKPKYQSIDSKDIPNLSVGEHSELRVIAGKFNDKNGPAATFTPINMYDISSEDDDQLLLPFASDTNTIILVLQGRVSIEGQSHDRGSILIFDRGGEAVQLEPSKYFKGLVLNGEPIDEPLVAHGPFVMNTEEEIREAIKEYQAGKLGRID